MEPGFDQGTVARGQGASPLPLLESQVTPPLLEPTLCLFLERYLPGCSPKVGGVQRCRGAWLASRDRRCGDLDLAEALECTLLVHIICARNEAF